ncbi:MAG: NAD-dependent epimerase/dehydratase family protein, partial [Algicola sp.]|nr:NAD-dependent epimerase/dehydratase family protein [Algicola sp.]
MSRILIVGASGYIGTNLVDVFCKEGQYEIIALSRSNNKRHEFVEYFELDDFHNLDAKLIKELNVDTVIYLAGIAHQKTVSEEQMLLVNRDLPIHIAKSSKEAAVSKFIFLSTAGVFGSSSERPVNEFSSTYARSTYARSKLEAEHRLQQVFDSSPVKLIIVRPPMVYGPGSPGNFSLLARIIAKPIPLPFGLVDTNARSFVYIKNLCDMIVHVV